MAVCVILCLSMAAVCLVHFPLGTFTYFIKYPKTVVIVQQLTVFASVVQLFIYIFFTHLVILSCVLSSCFDFFTFLYVSLCELLFVHKEGSGGSEGEAETHRGGGTVGFSESQRSKEGDNQTDRDRELFGFILYFLHLGGKSTLN